MNYSFLNEVNEDFISLGYNDPNSSTLDRQMDINMLTQNSYASAGPAQNNFQNALSNINYNNSPNSINSYNNGTNLAGIVVSSGSTNNTYQGNNANQGNNKKQNDPTKINLQWTSAISNKMTAKDNKYYFQTPYHKYFELVSEFGQPSVLDTNAGGLAIWNSFKLKGLYHRLEITDTQLYNKYPYPHIGFLYAYYKIDIPLNKLAQTLSISSDIKYDIIDKVLIVRGMAIGYCNALIALVIKYIRGEYSWYQIKNKNILSQVLSYKSLTNKHIRDENIKLIAYG
jgi:hypothetical protein